MNEPEDLYEILQVSPSAEPDVIRAAYLQLVRRYHPDFNTSPETEDMIRRLNLAHAVLSDPVRRADYDRKSDPSSSPARGDTTDSNYGQSKPGFDQDRHTYRQEGNATHSGDNQSPQHTTTGSEVSQTGQYRAWMDDGWLDTYFERGRPLQYQLQDFKCVEGLPVATKRGLCIYIYDVGVVELLLRLLFRAWGQESFWKRLTRREIQPTTQFRITQEIASYVLFETAIQVLDYELDGTPHRGAQETLDTVCYWFAATYDIPSGRKLQEYQRAGNPLEHVGMNVARIFGTTGLEEILNASVAIHSGIQVLFEGVESTFYASLLQLQATIVPFFGNAWDVRCQKIRNVPHQRG